MKKIPMTLPNFLTFLRLMLGFVLFAIALLNEERAIVFTLLYRCLYNTFAFFLDLIDGPIARWTHKTSELGSWLDSIADFSVYMAFTVGAWLLWPEIILRELIYVCLLVFSIVIPVLVGYIKFHKSTSYHTWLVKFAVACMAPASIILFIGGPVWPFQVASIISVFAGLEEIIITCMLDKPRSNLKSIVHIVREQKKI